jgi:hypothetical protein
VTRKIACTTQAIRGADTHYRHPAIGWAKLDDNSRTTAITAAGAELYQLHDHGSVRRRAGGQRS